MTEQLQVTRREAGVRFSLRVKPRSSRSELLGVREGVLSVALKAPPVDGAANMELLKLLARTLGVSRTAMSIVSGSRGQRKTIQVEGLERSVVRARLES